MTIKVTCTYCSESYSLDETAPEKLLCRKCGKPLTINDPSGDDVAGACRTDEANLKFYYGVTWWQGVALILCLLALIGGSAVWLTSVTQNWGFVGEVVEGAIPILVVFIIIEIFFILAKIRVNRKEDYDR